MAAYGRRVGPIGILCVQSGTPAKKLASIRPYAVLMIEVPGMGPAVTDEFERIAESAGGLPAGTARRLADTKMPGSAVIACQPEGCAPIELAAPGDLEGAVVAEGRTMISGLQPAKDLRRQTDSGAPSEICPVDRLADRMGCELSGRVAETAR
ncbi:hypothetical protein [Kribbella sp. NPDC050459]|uniref:hypothetical protein n=1 Tax=Kribbella sp. NPDC050459 TaxID=3155785 RepID=UPI0033DBB0C6